MSDEPCISSQCCTADEAQSMAQFMKNHRDEVVRPRGHVAVDTEIPIDIASEVAGDVGLRSLKVILVQLIGQCSGIVNVGGWGTAEIAVDGRGRCRTQNVGPEVRPCGLDFDRDSTVDLSSPDVDRVLKGRLCDRREIGIGDLNVRV